MAYNSYQINNAANNNLSKYNSVNKYAQNAYSALDNYFQNSSTAKNEAYKLYQNALSNGEKQSSDILNQQKNIAYNNFYKNKQNAYSSYAKATNNVGVFGNKIIESGLKGSGYEQAAKTMSFSDYQKDLSLAQSKLSSSIKSYDKEYVDALIVGNTEKAKINLQMAQDGANLQKDISEMLSIIAQNIMQMEYNEKSLDAQNATSTASNNLALKNLELQRAISQENKYISQYEANIRAEEKKAKELKSLEK